MPIDENTPLKLPESSYGKTKQMGEEILKDFATAHQKKVTLLRYFNPIGAHPSAKLGELPIGIPNNLVPYVMQTAAGVREKLSVWGNDYPTEDGTAIRDYIYVVDLAKAHVNGELEHDKSVVQEFFSKQGGIPAFLLGFRRQIKENHYPHISVCIKS